MVLLALSTVSLIFISFTSANISINSFLLLVLDSHCYFFSIYSHFKIRLLIWDLSAFFNIGFFPTMNISLSTDSTCQSISFGMLWFCFQLSLRIGHLGFHRGSVVKNPLAKPEMWIHSLCQEDPLEGEMAMHSSIFTWEIPWTEESGRLQSMESQESQSTLSNLTTVNNWRF